MQQRTLGRHGLTVSALGLGTMGSKIEYSVCSALTGCTAWARRMTSGPASLSPKCGLGIGFVPYSPLGRASDGRLQARGRLAENVGAADVTLTDADLERVLEIVPHGAFGSRYPVAMMPAWS